MARFAQSVKGVRFILKTLPGFILRQTPYRNADAMLTVLTSEGFLTMQALGALKMTSSFQAVTALGSWANFTIRESKKKAYLEKAELIQFAPLPNQEGLLASMMMEALIQVLLLDESHDQGELLYTMLKHARGQWQTPYFTYLQFLMHYLTLQGVPLVVDYCVRCQSKKQIVGVSTPLGGFICQTCFPQVDAQKLSAVTLTLLRQFSEPAIDPNVSQTDFLPIIPLLHDHFRYHLEARLMGFDNLEAILPKIHL